MKLMMSHARSTLFAMVCAILGWTSAQAQWSTGAPGDRIAPPGKNRYCFFVFGNPVPGKEQLFDDWYLQQHLGDLVQLEGWTGAQRYRLITDVPTPPAHKSALSHYGYSVLWDQEDSDPEVLRERSTASGVGGKTRRGVGFDYTPGASPNITYRIVTPRVLRADGRGPFIPAYSDNKTPRPNRYVLMEFTEPSPGESDASFSARLDERIKAGLTLPGWLAAQRMVLEPSTPDRARFTVPTPRHLTLWEVEATTAQAAKVLLDKATASGAMTTPQTIQWIWWEPISPYITKQDFQR